MRDGLPSNIIAAVTQDRYDFIWIGTGSGVSRFDGNHFKTFRKTGSNNSLPSDEITSLLADGDYVWVGTWKGLCKINVITFEVSRVPIDGNPAVRTIYKGHGDILWIGTTSGLIRYQYTTNQYKFFDSENSGLSHNTVRAIYEDRSGNLWVGTYDRLNMLPFGGDHFTVFDLKRNYKPSLKNNLVLDIKSAEANTDSMLYVGTETGLVLFNTHTQHFTRYAEENASFSNEVIKCIYTDYERKVWLGTDFGLNVFNPTAGSNLVLFHNPKLAYSIANNVIWQIFEDSGGVIWFATANGLSKLNKYGNFYEYKEISHEVENQTIGNQVKSILITHSGEYWLATQHGAIRMDPVKNTKEVFDNRSLENRRLLLNNVFALEEDKCGRIWIGTAGGINVWDPIKKEMHAFTASSANGLTSNYIGKFTKASDGSFWVSAWEGGLFKIEHTDRLADVHFTPIDEIGSEKHVSGNGALWVVEYDELYRIDLATHIKTQIKSFSEVSNKAPIYCLYISGNGNLWAGTQNGLVEYDPALQHARLHPIINGSDIIIYSLMEDNSGNIWGAANTSLQKYYVKGNKFETFPLDRNIPLKSFYYGCSAKSESGEIIFGGDNGYIIFSPERTRTNAYQPMVYVTSLQINNKGIGIGEAVDGNVILVNDISFTRELELKYGQRSIAFEFSSLHYWQPSMNVYSYKLDGLDKDWNYTTGLKNFAVYSNLPSGQYTLKVKGTNNYGMWGDAVSTIHITVKPPIFLSWQFIALYIILIAIAIYYALRTYSARVHLNNELKIIRMEKEHAEEIERTKEQFFTNISHELRTPISLILPPIHEIIKRGNLDEESERLIGLAEKNSLRLLRLVNQILDFNKLDEAPLQLKVISVNLTGFCRDIHGLFADKARRTGISFELNNIGTDCRAWVDPEKIETVLFNLLSNAFKFTPKGGRVDIRVSTLPSMTYFPHGAAEIKVCDSGVGLTDEEQKRVFDRFYQSHDGKKMDIGSGIGLTLAAEYVKLHHGEIFVESTRGKGSCFTIRLPLGKNHLPIDSIRDDQEIKLLATRSAYANEKGGKPYQIDLKSEKPMLLLVEDNPDMVDFIRVSLSSKYNFIIAENGAEGLLKANNFLPDVIVSDVMMSEMDGITLCNRIKENPKTSPIGIILLTARSLTSQKVEGIRSGADAYLTKPFEVELLDATIAHLLKRKKEMEEYFKQELIVHTDDGNGSENVDNIFVRRVMDVIEANIAEPDFSVEKLSKEIGMSSTHLSRKLKSLTHFSANEIIKKYRLKKASILLRNNEGNISEIMYDIGFSNLSYFSKCFKMEYGVTPREYQQKTTVKAVDIKTEFVLRSLL